MPEPITVWMVHLGRGLEPKEVKGILSLETDTLIFTHATQEGTTRFPLEHVRRVRRNRGTPILMVEWIDREARRSTAFYFVKPPPLNPEDRGGIDDPSGALFPKGGLASLRKPSKRRQHKTNVHYLTSSASTMKPVVEAWVDELGSLLGGR